MKDSLCRLLSLLMVLHLSVWTPAAVSQTASPRPAQAPPSQTQTMVTPPAGQLILEDGTPVKLRIGQTVSSESAHVGETVDFEVLEEVKVGGIIVIPKGGIAWATVTEAQPKRRMGRGGKLDMNIDSVRLVGGEKGALRAVKEVKGGGHVGAMTGAIVATSLLFFPAAPFFLFMHGKDISIPKGTELTAFVNGNITLDVAKLQEKGASPQVGAATNPPVVQPAAQTQANPNAEIAVTSTPDGAEIHLDGDFAGSTPSTMAVPPGDHVISITKRGYKPWERKLKTSSGQINVAADLEAEAKPEQKIETVVPAQTSPTPVAAGQTATAETLGMVSVTSDPAGAEIFVDESSVGVAPLTLKLKSGQHSIRAFMKDYKNWGPSAVTVESGRETHLMVTMNKGF